MKKTVIPAGILLLLILSLTGAVSMLHADGPLDGSSDVVAGGWLPANTFGGPDGYVVDVVGDTSNSSSAAGRAKGNSYQVDIDVILDEAEFWLNFSDSQTLTYYVFVCPTEFGTYTEVYRASEPVSGSGVGWYSSGTLSVEMDSGFHYIIAVSWTGTMTYYYGTGDSQATSFGSQTHGYASGFDPLPASFQSTSNDQAIYHQRLNTTVNVALERTTWGDIKALW